MARPCPMFTFRRTATPWCMCEAKEKIPRDSRPIPRAIRREWNNRCGRLPGMAVSRGNSMPGNRRRFLFRAKWRTSKTINCGWQTWTGPQSRGKLWRADTAKIRSGRPMVRNSLLFLRGEITPSSACMTPVNSSVRFLSPSVDSDSTPRWSLDGKTIAFIRRPAKTRDHPEGFFIAPDEPEPWAIWIADVSNAPRVKSGTAARSRPILFPKWPRTPAAV